MQEIHWRGRNICVQPPLGLHERINGIKVHIFQLPLAAIWNRDHLGTAVANLCFIKCAFEKIHLIETHAEIPKCIMNVPISQIL